MFHDIPAEIRARMQELQMLDREQRAGAAPPEQWIRALQPETGRLVALLAASAPAAGAFVELGGGAGYSTMWLSLAVRARSPHPRFVSFELNPEKARLANETLERTGFAGLVELRIADASTELKTIGPIAFAFMDHGPRNYEACRELLLTALTPGGILTIDNIDSHHDITAPLVGALTADPRVDATVLHVGKGLLLARKCGLL